MTSVSHVFSASTGIVAQDFNDNFNDVTNAIDNIVNAMIAAGAGITSDKLADRYIVEEPTILVVPYAQNADWSGALTEYTAPGSDTVVARYMVTLKSGQDAFLCGVNVYLHNVTVSGGNYPTLSIYVNSVQVGGGAIVLDNEGDPNGFFRLQQGTPIDTPLLALADGDKIEIRLNRQGGTPTLAGLYVSPVIKKELVA